MAGQSDAPAILNSLLLKTGLITWKIIGKIIGCLKEILGERVCVCVKWRKQKPVQTFVLVEFWVEVVESGNDEVIDKADLVTEFLHLG